MWEDTTFTMMYGPLQLKQHCPINKRGSFFERTIWPNLGQNVKAVDNAPYLFHRYRASVTGLETLVTDVCPYCTITIVMQWVNYLGLH